jgi:hypothetical protein
MPIDPLKLYFWSLPMSSKQNLPPASIFRLALFALLGVALLASGAFQSISAYPSPAAMGHLGDALTALWSSIGFISGVVLLITGLALQVPSSYLLRRRWQRRQALGGRGNPGNAVFASPAGHRPPKEYEFGPQPGAEDYRFDSGTDDIGPYAAGSVGPMDGYPNSYEQERSGGHVRGRGNGYGRSGDHARFEQRRWAGSSR